MPYPVVWAATEWWCEHNQDALSKLGACLHRGYLFDDQIIASKKNMILWESERSKPSSSEGTCILIWAGGSKHLRVLSSPTRLCRTKLSSQLVLPLMPLASPTLSALGTPPCGAFGLLMTHSASSATVHSARKCTPTVYKRGLYFHMKRAYFPFSIVFFGPIMYQVSNF